MNDLLEPIKRELSERLSSPLLGGFAISWALWNYKFLLILASNNTISTTFSLVERYCFSGPIEIVTHGFVLPALTTLGYIYLYPLPAEIIYKRAQQNNKRLKEIRIAIEGETPLTIEESRRVRLQLFQASEQHAKELEAKISEIGSLKEALKAANDQLTNGKPLPYRKYKRLPPLQQRILEAIAQKEDGTLPRSVLLKKLEGTTPVEIEFALGELREDSLISDVTDEDLAIAAYQITHNGRGNLLHATPQEDKEE